MKKLLFAASLLVAGALSAETTPVMVSLVTPVQAPSSVYDVKGFRLSLIYGSCRDFAGLDIGVANRAAGDFTGLGIGGVNIAGDRLRGGQVGLINWNSQSDTEWTERSIGAQIGLLNYADSLCGLQDGLVNISGNLFSGVESGLVNYANDLQGVQFGYYFVFGVNVVSGSLSGCQLGLVNYAESVAGGLQIGLINIIARNGWLPVLPIVNGHF